MPLLVLSLLVLAARTEAAAPPVLELDDPAGCVAKDELLRDLEALLPDEVARERLRLRVHVMARQEARAIHMEVGSLEGERPFLIRNFDVVAVDCPDVPRLLARIVSRQIARLDDEERRAIAAPPPTTPSPTTPLDAQPPAPEPRPEVPPPTRALALRLKPAVSLGGGVGLVPPLATLGATASLALGAEGWPDAIVRLDVGMTPTLPVGKGGAQLVLPRLGVGAGYPFDLGLGTLSPQAFAWGGLATAWGVLFDRPELALLPMGGVLLSVAWHSPFGLFAELGVDVPFTALRLVESGGGGGAFDALLIGPFARVGFAWDL